jgi:hypothetical protein
MDILTKFQRVWNGDAETCWSPLFCETFGGFFGFLEEEKRSQITNIEKKKMVSSTFDFLKKLDNFSLLKFSQFFFV